MDVRILVAIVIALRHADIVVNVGLKPRFIAVVGLIIKRDKKPHNKSNQTPRPLQLRLDEHKQYRLNDPVQFIQTTHRTYKIN